MGYLQLYKKSQTFLIKVNVFFQTVFNGFWLGILNPENLHKIDELYYNDSVGYCTVNYNKRGLSKWETEMVENYFRDYRSLLLIGAGGGREVFSLQKMGYEVEAFECNPKLLNFGNKFLADEGLKPCIKQLERDQSPKSREKYDAIIIGWGAYMLIQGRTQRIAFLESMRSLIKDDGKILLSFLSRTRTSRHLKNTAFIGNIFRFLLRREYLQVGDTLVPNYIHYFTEEELSDELSKGGFDMIYYAEKPYGHAVAGVKNEQ